MVRLVYKGKCEGMPRWWFPGELIDCQVCYEDTKFHIGAIGGRRWDKWHSGQMMYLDYDSWEDVLADWATPKVVEAESWLGQGPRQNFEGNTKFDEFAGIQETFHEILIEGWDGDRKVCGRLAL